MLNGKSLGELDQMVTTMNEFVPKLVAGFYKGLIAEGISEPQALVLTQQYVGAMTYRGEFWRD